MSQILFHGGGCLLTLLSPAVLTLSKGLKAAVPAPPKKSIVPLWVSVFSPRLALHGFPFSLRVLPSPLGLTASASPASLSLPGN